MLGKYALVYVLVVDTIDQMIQTLALIEKARHREVSDTNTDRIALALMGKEPKLPKEASQSIDEVISNLVNQLSSRMPIPSVVAQAKRIKEALEKGEGAKAVGALMREFKTRLLDELSERHFLYVPPDRVDLYMKPMLFGKEVNDRFSAAIDDIEEAGKCLALGQGTACVLHTMRILEVGLKALAAALNIPYAPSWESYLSQISTNIAKKHKNKTKAWRRDEKFYRDLSGDLLIVKQAFRNPTMHVDRKYGVDEAEQIFAAAKTFMVRLVEHFSQKDLEKLLKRITEVS
jgi:hypothetical protein